jgi:hypothetical protein
MDSGVKVVGATSTTAGSSTSEGSESERSDVASSAPSSRRPGGPKRFVWVSVAAVLGLVGTLVFGGLWLTKGSSPQTDPAMVSTARAFVTDLTNFSAKSVDADFSSITAMATGSFQGQASKFFNSSIRTALEKALAESRGQIRYLDVQNESATQASVYAVIDQVYANNKISTPQADVLRLIVNLQKVGSDWKISDVTVLEGASPTGAANPSGSAGSAVPGQ